MADEFDLIDDVYQYRSTIFRGNQTRVDEVVEQGTGRQFAMKIVIEGTPNSKESKANLKKEAAVLKQMEHPNIIKFEKFSTSHDATYILMEYFRAASVKAQLKGELLNLHSRARQLMEGICQALSYLHEKGWVHRDLKPDNMLVNRAGEVRLLDFSLATREVQGVAKMLGMGRQKMIQGTRTYIAPETIRKLAPTAQTDIYSLGIAFFEILTGRTPFQGATPDELLQKHLKAEAPSPSELNPNVTPEMDRVIASMLRKKPKERPATVDEVRVEIGRIKLFKQDLAQIKAAEEEKVEAEKLSVAAKLDSRTDAIRTEMLQANPELAEQFEAERRDREARRKAKNKPRLTESKSGGGPPKAAPAAPPASVPPPAPPMMAPSVMSMPMMAPSVMSMPVMPGYPQPPMAYPGYPPGMMPPPGYPPMAANPYAQPPGMPQAPPAAPPPVAPPARPPQAPPPPTAVRPPTPPTPNQPPAVRPPAPPPPARPPAPSGPPSASGLDFMTELPDVV